MVGSASWVNGISCIQDRALSGPLFDFYRRATDRMLLVRGKLRLGDVYGGIKGPLLRHGDPAAGD